MKRVGFIVRVSWLQVSRESQLESLLTGEIVRTLYFLEAVKGFCFQYINPVGIIIG